jgi:hypothetical protein
MPRGFVLALFLIVFVTACSDPPVKERNEADGALAAARAADAAIYAPEELKASEAALRKYDDAVAQRDYRQALNAALDARDRAYEAAKQASSAKAAAQNQSEKLVADIGTLTAAGNSRLAGTSGPRPAGAAADRLRAAVHAAGPALQEARTLLDKKDYRGAIDKLTPAVDALRKEMPAVDLSGRRRGR